MLLTDAEYQDAYAEALRCLADEGHAVGEPYISGTGERYCMVDNGTLSDREVLDKWWTRDIASAILQGRNR